MQISKTSINFNNIDSSSNKSNPIYFGQDNQKISNNSVNEQKKKLNYLNYTLTAITLALMSMPLIISLTRGKPERLANKTAKLARDSAILNQKIENIASQQTGKIKSYPLIVRFGQFMDNISKNHKELVNNLIYASGVLAVEPLVILFSPFGHNKAKKEDKVFALWRQPITFFTTFGMQYSVDKLIQELIPKLSKKGKLGKEFQSFSKTFNDLTPTNRTKLKVFQTGTVLILNLLTLPLSVTMQVMLYGKFMKHFHPEKPQEEGEK